jgi:chorismate mutase
MRWRRRLVQWLGIRNVRAIRGATTVERDEPAALRDAVRGLLAAMRSENHLEDGEVISALFTLTPDLRSAFPATMAREFGWDEVPLLCASEIAVPGGLPRCLRVLLHVERCWGAAPARHVYLGAAAALRPDLAAGARSRGTHGAGGVPQCDVTMPRTISTTPMPRRT